MQTELSNKEDAVLDYTQAKREEIVKKLTPNGMTGDIKEISVILAALDGMDRAALTKKRIQSDSDLGSKSAIAGAAITEILSNMRDSLVGRSNGGTASKEQTDDNVGVPTPTIIPGELDGANSSVSYDNIVGEEDL